MKIRKAYKIFFGLILLLAYFIFMRVFVANQYDKLHCSTLNILIDNSYSFITQDGVKKMIKNRGILIDSTVKISDLNFDEIENVISKNPYVEDVQVYNNFDGDLFVKIEQREPMLRIMTCDTASFYIDKNLKVMPVCDFYTANVLVLSGFLESKCFYNTDTVNDFKINSSYNALNISEISTFVKYIESSELWKNQITQIYVNEKNEIELVPRVGNHIILLGSLNDYENKLDKMEAMYHEGFKLTEWNIYSTINLKYKDQVICKKR